MVFIEPEGLNLTQIQGALCGIDFEDLIAQLSQGAGIDQLINMVRLTEKNYSLVLFMLLDQFISFVKPRPEVHMDMIIFEVFLKNIHLNPQDQIHVVQWHYL